MFAGFCLFFFVVARVRAVTCLTVLVRPSQEDRGPTGGEIVLNQVMVYDSLGILLLESYWGTPSVPERKKSKYCAINETRR